MYDPWETADEAERNEWAIRDHLYAKRRLAELAEKGSDSKQRVRKMLEAVVPGPKFCGQVGSRIDGKPGKVCGKPGVRMIALTGTWVCAGCDPLNRPAPAVTRCCGRSEIELCDARQGAWGCTAGIADHAWPHRFRRLRGGSE